MKNQVPAFLVVAFLSLVSASNTPPSGLRGGGDAAVMGKGEAAVMHSKRFLTLCKGQPVMQGTLERLKERYVCVFC